MNFAYILIALAIKLGICLTSEFQVPYDIEVTPNICHRKAELGDSVMIKYECAEPGDELGDLVKDADLVLGLGRFDELLEQGLLHMCAGEIRHVHLPGHGSGKSDLRRLFRVASTKSLECRVMCTNVRDRHYRDPHTLHHVFQQIDIDEDKELTDHEVRQYFRKHQKLDEVPETFWEQDVDNNTIISFEEFAGPKGLTEAESSLHVSGALSDVNLHTLKVGEEHFRRAKKRVDKAHGKYHKHRGWRGDEL